MRPPPCWRSTGLWSLSLPVESLLPIAAKLGADVPVFVFGRSALAEGIGEKLTAMDLPEQTYLVVVPDCHVATAEIFSHEALTRDTKKKRIAAFPDRGQTFKNDCEPLVRRLYPEVDAVFRELSVFGEPRMTGTGSCVFLTFDSDRQAQQVAVKLRSELKAHVVRGMNTSAAIATLEDSLSH